MPGMTQDPFTSFDRAAAIAENAIAAVKPDQFDDPTPCPDWTVRQLINHVVGGNKLFAALVTGGPRPDRSADHLGADPLAAFRSTVREVRAAFASDGALERSYELPIGSVPGAFALR